MRFRRSMSAAVIQSSASLLVLAGLDDGADVFVAERHDLLGGPERIVRQAIGERRDRLVRRPLLRVERVGFERADLTKVRDTWPSSTQACDAHARDVAPDGTQFRKNGSLPSQVSFGTALNAAAERSCEVDQVMTDSRRRRRWS